MRMKRKNWWLVVVVEGVVPPALVWPPNSDLEAICVVLLEPKLRKIVLVISFVRGPNPPK